MPYSHGSTSIANASPLNNTTQYYVMSLHAQLSPEAAQKLRETQRNSTILSIMIALLSCVLLGFLLAFILLSPNFKKTPEIITFNAGLETNEVVEKPQITNTVERKPSAPSSSASRVIASTNMTNVSIPVPKFDSPTPTIEFGDGEDFGSGWGGSGNGSGNGGAVGGFGSPNKVGGTLTGYLYDFKQTSRGTPVNDYDTANRSHYTDRIESIQRARFSDSSLRKFYKAPQALYVRYVAIPFSNATDGPKFFNAEKEVEPSGWLVHYSGKLKVPEDGEYRLVGCGDDYLGVSIDNKMRLVAPWTDMREILDVPGANARNQPNHVGPLGGTTLVYGEWFSLRKGDTIDVNVGIGERPGGKVGFVLMIQKKGVEYKKDSAGNPILPPFVFGQLEPGDLDYLEKFRGWKFDTYNIPMFQAVE